MDKKFEIWRKRSNEEKRAFLFYKEKLIKELISNEETLKNSSYSKERQSIILEKLLNLEKSVIDLFKIKEDLEEVQSHINKLKNLLEK